MSKSAPLRPEDEIAVFAKGTRTSGLAWFRASYEDALYYVRMELARWVNNNRKSIIMIVARANFKVRDRSCQMGQRVIEAVAEGEKSAMALMPAWKFAGYGVYCEWPKAA